MTVKETLEAEVKALSEKIHKMEPGTKEHETATEALCKLNKALIDWDATELPREKHEEEVKLSDRREANAEVKYEEDRALELGKQRDVRIKMVIDGAIALLSVAVTVGGWKFYKFLIELILRYEEKGSVTSAAGRLVLNSLNKIHKN